jgi:hypothetical protein
MGKLKSKEHWWRDNGRELPKDSEKPCSSTDLPTTNRKRIGVRLNTVLLEERPPSDLLSSGKSHA